MNDYKKKLSKFCKLIDNSIIKNIIIFICSASISLLSTYLMIGMVTKKLKFITLIITFLFSIIYLHKNYDNIIDKFKTNKRWCIISFIQSLIIFYMLSVTSNIENKILNNELIYYASFVGLTFIITLCVIKIKDWLKKFINLMDNFEKKAYIITSLITIFMLLILYLKTDFFYLQYDKVYSMDSGWVYNNILPDVYYYDIRHPLMSIFTFPIYAITSFIFSSKLVPIILQFLNIQLLILIGLELKRMTKNKFVYIFYMLSFPSILFSVFLEKYILCVFFVVTYLYDIFINERSNNSLLTFIVGIMPTNIFIAASEFFRNNKFKDKIKNIIKIAAISVLIFIISGRIHCLVNGRQEIEIMRNSFASNKLTITEKFNSTTKMIEHSFIALDSNKNIEKDIYIWNDITNNISYIAIVIVIIILLGFKDIFKTKNKVYYSFILSFVFSIILFMVLNWSVHESPLFSICFSWSIIPLFILGLEKIFSLLKINKNNYKYIYIVIFLIITTININGIINICNNMLLS